MEFDRTYRTNEYLEEVIEKLLEVKPKIFIFEGSLDCYRTLIVKNEVFIENYKPSSELYIDTTKSRQNVIREFKLKTLNW